MIAIHRMMSKWSILVLVSVLALGLTGCSKKKTTPPDVTETTPNPGGSGNDGTNSDGNNNTDPSGDQTDRSINDIFFDYNDHTLSAEARSTLSSNASYLREMGAIRVTIEGHCDERGTVEFNLALGQRRADATRGYLADLGVEASRMSTISYGEERPFEMGHDESSWSQNRRGHFRVINP